MFPAAYRRLSKDAWFSAGVFALLTSALTVFGAAFAVADDVLFADLPYARGGEFFLISGEGPVSGTEEPHLLSGLEFHTLREMFPDVETSAARLGLALGPVRGRQVFGWFVTPDFFEVLGVRPTLGGLTPEYVDWYRQPRSAERSTRRKSEPYRSAMSMLTFYMNRAGRNLPAERRRTLERAKDELRKLYGRA